MPYGSWPNSMSNRLRLAAPLIKSWPKAFFRTPTLNQWLLSILILSGTSQAMAQQCFVDAKQAYAYLLDQQARQLVEVTKKKEVININKATEAELTRLQGVGSSKAQQIILYRQAFGDFNRVEDLAKVKGIGEKTLIKNKARMSVKD